MTDNIKELEKALADAEIRIGAIFKAGKIPTTADHERVAAIKRQLKSARRVATMSANRRDPLKTERLTVQLSADTLAALKRNADEKGLSLSEHLRNIIDKSIT